MGLPFAFANYGRDLWLSFRLSDSGQWAASYDKRYKDLVDEIKDAAGGQKWWYETSSFFLFASSETTDTLVLRIKRAIDVRADLLS